MGQIVSSAAKPKRCNFQSLSSLGTPAAGEHILVSLDNSMNAAGQGHFNAYIVGDGATAATALPLLKFVKNDLDGGEYDALSAEQGKVLKEMWNIGGGYITGFVAGAHSTNGNYTESILNKQGAVTKNIEVEEGETYILKGVSDTSFYYRIYAVFDSTGARLDRANSGNFRENPLVVTIPPNGKYMTINLISYDATTDSAFKKGTFYGVSEIKGDINTLNDKWKEEDTQISTKSGAYSTAGTKPENIISLSGCQTALFSVTEGQIYKIYGKSNSNNYYRIYGLWREDGTSIAVGGTGVYRDEPLTLTIPSDGKYLAVNLNEYDASTDKILLVGNTIDVIEIEKKISQVNPSALSKQINNDRLTRVLSDRYASVMVDWMQVVAAGSGINNNRVMEVVSSTADTITLSSEDATDFVGGSPIVVHYPNGDAKLAYVQAANGNVISRYPTDTTDFTGADLIQSIHDTARGGYGIHLSQLGYIMLAQFTAQEVASKFSQKDSNLIAGLRFYNSSIDGTDVVDIYGNVVATIDTTFKQGGFTPNGTGKVQKYEITSNDSKNSELFGYLYTAFRVLQGIKDDYIAFNFDAVGKGFVEIECGISKTADTSTGTATLIVYADGEEVERHSLRSYFYRFQIENVDAGKNISIKFVIDDNLDTEFVIYSMAFYAMDGRIPAIDLTGKKIAVLGDSWTQFPGLPNAIPQYQDYNTLVVRPDGTNGDGCGYFPKELARVTGASVDNWGKSNMRADNWGLLKIDEILAYTQYDYLIIEFFTNDVNANIPVDEWSVYIALIAEKCKKACVRPLIMMPCRNNGSSINPFGIYHERALFGLSYM